MHKRFALMLSAGMMSVLLVLPACSTPASQPAPSTPLPQGVFSATDNCDIRITSPAGGQTTETQALSIAFEINDRGVPIVLGEEIAVGRTVEHEGIQVTYTRIEATSNGIIIHSTITGSVNNVSSSGSAIATLSATESGEIQYDITSALTDSDGFLYNSGCTFFLAR